MVHFLFLGSYFLNLLLKCLCEKCKKEKMVEIRNLKMRFVRFQVDKIISSNQFLEILLRSW